MSHITQHIPLRHHVFDKALPRNCVLPQYLHSQQFPFEAAFAKDTEKLEVVGTELFGEDG
jgi:hypothetical protein